MFNHLKRKAVDFLKSKRLAVIGGGEVLDLCAGSGAVCPVFCAVSFSDRQRLYNSLPAGSRKALCHGDDGRLKCAVFLQRHPVPDDREDLLPG